jgi:hypothetical protein
LAELTPKRFCFRFASTVHSLPSFPLVHPLGSLSLFGRIDTQTVCFDRCSLFFFVGWTCSPTPNFGNAKWGKVKFTRPVLDDASPASAHCSLVILDRGWGFR